MQLPYTIEDFINSKLFNNNLFKIKLLAFSDFRANNVKFTDLYIKSHNDYFVIYTATDLKTNKQNIEIFKIDSIWELRLHNIIYNTKYNKLHKIPFYIPKKDKIVTIIEKEDGFLKNNIFSLSKNHINIDVKKSEYNKTNSIEFATKYFSDDKDFSTLIFRIKENDKFTASSVRSKDV